MLNFSSKLAKYSFENFLHSFDVINQFFKIKLKKMKAEIKIEYFNIDWIEEKNVIKTIWIKNRTHINWQQWIRLKVLFYWRNVKMIHEISIYKNMLVTSHETESKNERETKLQFSSYTLRNANAIDLSIEFH